MTQQDIDNKYNDIISSYLEIKPVLADLYRKNGNNHIDGILNEIRALNDHIARCYCRTDLVENYNELCRAEGHLKRLIYDIFKQLNIIFFDYTKDKEQRYFGEHWIRLNGGQFWREYLSLRENITSNIEQAKIFEAKDTEKALYHFQEAYTLQYQVYELLEKNQQDLEVTWINDKLRKVNSLKGWVISTILLAIIPSLLWELYIHWSCISSFFHKILLDVIHTFGAFLLKM